MAEPEGNKDEKSGSPGGAPRTGAVFVRLLEKVALGNSLARIVLFSIFIALTVVGLHFVHGLDIQMLSALIGAYPAVSLIVFIVVFACCTILLMPTLPLNLLAGALWGTVVGGFVTSFAGAVGALVCVLLVRRVFGEETARSLCNRRYDIIVDEFERSELLVVALFRLNPALPSVMNYVFAFLPISAIRFGFLTFLFSLPISFAIGAVGAISGAAVSSGAVPDLAQWIILGMAITVSAFSLVFVLYLKRVRARR